MPQKSKRPKLKLNEEQRQYLQQIGQSRTAPFREVQRANILLKYSDDNAITDIAEDFKVTRTTIYKCIDKALAGGIEIGLKDTYHKAKDVVITEEAKAWVVSIACEKPKKYGYAAELWTYSSLAKHIRKKALESGIRLLKQDGEGYCV